MGNIQTHPDTQQEEVENKKNKYITNKDIIENYTFNNNDNNSVFVDLEKEKIKKVKNKQEQKHYSKEDIKSIVKDTIEDIFSQLKVLESKNSNNDITTKNINDFKNNGLSKSKMLKNIQGVVRVNVIILDYNIFNPSYEGQKNIVSGTAFFISPSHLVSCYHVVKNAIKIEIKINDKKYDTKIVSFCENLDIVLLKVDDITTDNYFELDDSDLVNMNDLVYAYGYPLGSTNLKITAGIVSGFEKDKIQIDAPINPGNSGGPLFNNKNKVIGINTSIIWGANGIGFATQINYFKNLFKYDIDITMISEKKGINKSKYIVNEDNFSKLKPYIVPRYFHFETIPIPDEILELNESIKGGVLITKKIDLDKININMSNSNSLQKNKKITEGDIICSIGDYKIDRIGMCYKEDNINRKIPFDSILNNLTDKELNDINICVMKNKNGIYEINKEIDKYLLIDITNVLPIKYDYERIITRSVDKIINLDGIIIQELNLNHIGYIVENGLTYNMNTQYIRLLDYINIDKWDKSVLFISYMDGDSEKAGLENIYLGDIILSINDKVVNTLEDLRNELERINSSDNMKIYYLNTKSTRIYFKKK